MTTQAHRNVRVAPNSVAINLEWLRTIQQEIEEKLLTRRSSSGAEGVAVR